MEEERMERGKEKAQRELQPSCPCGSPPVQSMVTLAHPAQRRDLGPTRASTQMNKQVIFSDQQFQSSHHIPGGDTTVKGGTCLGLWGARGTRL